MTAYIQNLNGRQFLIHAFVFLRSLPCMYAKHIAEVIRCKVQLQRKKLNRWHSLH